MTTVYIPLLPVHSPVDIWAEVEYGPPVPPALLEKRVHDLLRSQTAFATYSDAVISIIGYLVRSGQLTDAEVHYLVEVEDRDEWLVDARDNGRQWRRVRLDVKGDFIECPPFKDWKSDPTSVAFHYRFARVGEVLA